MQERYLADRNERFAIIARLIADTQDAEPLILDLGCGTGSLMAALLEAIPGAKPSVWISTPRCSYWPRNAWRSLVTGHRWLKLIYVSQAGFVCSPSGAGTSRG